MEQGAPMASDTRDTSVALSATPESLPAQAESAVRQALATLVETYGRAVYDEPARCEAMLHDLCPRYRREVFLTVAALKERVVSDLLLFGGVPDDVLVARNARKLQ